VEIQICAFKQFLVVRRTSKTFRLQKSAHKSRR